MNGATDGHAKNFSLFLRPGGRYQLATLYDVLPIHPVLGDGPAPISAHRARMAMAVRAKNPHWRIRDILRRHWTALGSRHGIVTEQGQPVDALIDDIVDRTPQVIDAVRSQLPPSFPGVVADSILQGLQAAAHQLAGDS